MAFSQSKNLIHPSQIGFIPGNRTADHIFTFKTLHDKYIKHENNKKMYACFVDFKRKHLTQFGMKDFFTNYYKTK